MGAGVDPSELSHTELDLLLQQADQERSGLSRTRPPAGGFREYSSSRQELLLSQVRRALAAAAAQREHTSMRERRLRRSADRLLEQARRALEAGREDYAQQSLAWRDSIRQHAAELDREQAELRAEQERLTALARQLQAGLPITQAAGSEAALLSGAASLADGLKAAPGPEPAATVATRHPGELVPVSEPAELLQLARRTPAVSPPGPDPSSAAEFC